LATYDPQRTDGSFQEQPKSSYQEQTYSAKYILKMINLKTEQWYWTAIQEKGRTAVKFGGLISNCCAGRQ